MRWANPMDKKCFDTLVSVHCTYICCILLSNMTGNQGHLWTSPFYYQYPTVGVFPSPPHQVRYVKGSVQIGPQPWQGPGLQLGFLGLPFRLTSSWLAAGTSNTKKKVHGISISKSTNYLINLIPTSSPLNKIANSPFFFASQSCSQSLAWQRNCGNQNNPRLRRLRRPPGVSTSARKTNVQHPVREPNLIGPLPRTKVGLPFMFKPLTSSFDVFFFFSSHGAFRNGKA